MRETSVFTLTYRGTPAQLVGLLWQDGDTGKVIIRLRGEGAYLRIALPRELEQASNLRPAAAPPAESSDWHVECLSCRNTYGQNGKRPDTCGACGSKVIKLTRTVSQEESNG